MPGDMANSLVRKLGLKQTPGKDTMKEFAKRSRALQREGRNIDQAGMIAAKEKFPAEFEPTRYANQGEPMETLLADIEKL